MAFKVRGLVSRPGVGWALTVAAAAVLAPPAVADDTDDFDAGTTPGWDFFDLTAVLNGFGIPGVYAHYTFPPDGNGGRAFEITTTSLPLAVQDQVGPPRAFAYPPTVYSRLLLHIDLLTWNTTMDQAFGPLFFAIEVGPGTTTGYVMNYNVSGSVIQLNSIAGEQPTTIAETPLTLNPAAHTYRWELSAYSGNLLGRVFQLPDTNNPIGSVIAIDSTTPSGVVGLLSYDRTSNPPYVGTDSTFDNYDAATPAAGSLTAAPVFLIPTPGSTVLISQPTIELQVLDRETKSDPTSFRLAVDGVAVPAGLLSVSNTITVLNNSTPFGGQTVVYVPATPLSAGVHEVQSVYADSSGAFFTNKWSFTTEYLSHPIVGTPEGSGFNVRVVQAPQSPVLANSLSRADAQLTTNSTIPQIYSTNVIASFINYSSKAIDGGTDSPFGNDQIVPGQIDDQTINNWAMLATTYLQLPAGLITLGVQCDDGYRVTSGGLVLGIHDGGPANQTFQFYVAEAGLYPFTLEWYQAGGAAYVNFFESTPTEHADTQNRVLLNTLDAYPAYPSVSVQPSLVGASSVSGPYLPVAGAVWDSSALTFTTPLVPGIPVQFYRVSATPGATISKVAISGDNLVIGYIPAGGVVGP